jgi:hypothetical protein
MDNVNITQSSFVQDLGSLGGVIVPLENVIRTGPWMRTSDVVGLQFPGAVS